MPATLAPERTEDSKEAVDHITVAQLPRHSVPPLVLAAEYWLRPQKFFDRCQKLGDRFFMKLPGMPPMVCVTNPKDIKAVFSGDQNRMRLGDGVKKIAPHEKIFGPETVTDGEEHRKQRKMLGPHFTPHALKPFEEIIIRKTEQAIEGWPMGSRVRFMDLMQDLTLDIIIDVLFGVTDVDRMKRLRAAVLHFMNVVSGNRFLVDFVLALARGGDWKGEFRYLRTAMDEVDAIVLEEMEERRGQTESERPGLLGTFLTLEDEDGNPMTDPYILNYMRGLLVAGFETTASSMAWLGERIVRHPEVLNELQKTVDAGSDDYVLAVVHEAMRIRPVTPITVRLVTESVDINGLQVEAGNLLVPFIQLVHHREDVYPEAHSFKPERFLNITPDRSAWIPFGGGVRMCLGGPLAMMEMRLIVRTMFQQLKFEPTQEPDEPLLRRTVTIAPGKGALLTMVKR